MIKKPKNLLGLYVTSQIASLAVITLGVGIKLNQVGANYFATQAGRSDILIDALLSIPLALAFMAAQIVGGRSED